MRPIPPQRAEFQSAIEDLAENLKFSTPELKERIISIYKGLGSMGFYMYVDKNKNVIYAYNLEGTTRRTVRHENDVDVNYGFNPATGQTWAEVTSEPIRTPNSQVTTRIYKDPVWRFLYHEIKKLQGKLVNDPRDTRWDDSRFQRSAFHTGEHMNPKIAQQELEDRYFNRSARFPAGIPADPTVNMSEEDAQTWWDMNEEHGDLLKKANSDVVRKMHGPVQDIQRVLVFSKLSDEEADEVRNWIKRELGLPHRPLPNSASDALHAAARKLQGPVKELSGVLAFMPKQDKDEAYRWLAKELQLR